MLSIEQVKRFKENADITADLYDKTLAITNHYFNTISIELSDDIFADSEKAAFVFANLIPALIDGVVLNSEGTMILLNDELFDSSDDKLHVTAPLSTFFPQLREEMRVIFVDMIITYLWRSYPKLFSKEATEKYKSLYGG